MTGFKNGKQHTRYHRIASVTTRRAGKSKFRLFGIVITQHSHILKIKIHSFVYWGIFYMYHFKYCSPIMLVAFYSRNERSAATQLSENKGKGIYRSKKEGRKYICFCGREHRWSTEIKKRSLEKEDESKNPIVREAFWAVGSPFYSNRSRLLKDSFLFDSASDSHIYNSRERFSNLTPAGEDCCVAGGGGDVKVHGFGTAVIRPKGATPNIDCELTLNDVAYVPGFPVNLVSYDKAMSKGIYWNGEEKTLVKMEN